MVLQWFFSVIPIELVKPILIIIPRLSVCAPPGISFLTPNYLGEFNINVDTVYPIERKMLTGIYEKDTIKIIGQLVKEGDICFDIGANIGKYSELLIHETNSQIIAFEPLPKAFDELQVMEKKFFSRFKAYNFAIGDKNCNLDLNFGSEISSVRSIFLV